MTDKEKYLEKHILTQTIWEDLPESIRKMLGNSRENWKTEVIAYALKYLLQFPVLTMYICSHSRYQLRWRDNILVKSLIGDERLYYQELIRWGILNFSVMILPFTCEKWCIDVHICSGLMSSTQTDNTILTFLSHTVTTFRMFL